GDCTNYASQCLYAGSGIMNYTPTYGWFYLSADDRTASWTGVQYFYNFLTQNHGVGPFGAEAAIDAVEPGDFVQLSFEPGRFGHTPIVVEIRGGRPTPSTIYLAAHSRDSDCRPLSSYSYLESRFLHVQGVRANPSPGLIGFRGASGTR
ncbi:MAG: amidase domain-containing protein, partial [Oscillospiraceae bacterium]